jgi:cyclin A
MELKPCATALHAFYIRASSRVISSLPAIREKYGQPKYKCVSTIAPPPELPSSLFSPDACEQ